MTLNLECTLSTLRAAATSLGLGKSGGKATVLKRISDHLKKQQLIQQHQARADLDKPVTPREQAVVNAPSLEEQRKHALTHLPYASWCPRCVSFRAKADRHLKITEDHRAVSTLAYDFCYTGRASDPEQKLTCLIMVDKHTKYVEALPVPAKGARKPSSTCVLKLCEC